MKETKKNAKEFGVGTFIFLAVFIGFFCYLGSVMGASNMLKTILNTGYQVLLETVFYICAVCVIMGAVGSLLTEFGVISLVQYLLSPLMKPVYGMPGASAVGIMTTFLSDNPAVLALAGDKRARKYFKKYQTPALCNLGTAFGMGMIVCSFMLGLGQGFVSAVGAGLIGAVAGSILSTRLMLFLTKRYYKKIGRWDEMNQMEECGQEGGEQCEEEKAKPGVFSRVMNCILEGGKLGWETCFAITPGVVVICTVVMMLTFGPGEGANGASVFTGAAYEGIALLPKFGNLIAPVTKVLFGFVDGSNIAVPITSLGAVGAAIGLIPEMVNNGLAGANEIAVFTAMGMCWSGYLSTHISMMEALGRRELISRALISHTIAGLFAGVVAHYVFLLIG
ncbi:MAG TPA: hypothetical protein H9887_09550 [Candidatus Dorea intestinavium]|nr:hypothetical protein [Candidatus Dorea intestinavium]